jgi:hypothetical protein
MNYNGDYAVGATVYIWFNTFSSDDPSASVTATDLVDTDIVIYKDDSLTQRANTTGVAIDVDVDTFAGVHKFTIDTSDNTVADFFEAGHDYACVAVGITVDAGSINACVGTFSIANRRTAGQMAVTSIEGLTDQNTFTLTTGEASADDDAYNDCMCIVTDQTTKIQKAIGYISDYNGLTRSVQLYASPLCTGFTMAIGDSVEIFSSSAFTNVRTVNRTEQTAGDIPALVTTVDTVVDGIQTDLDNGTDGLGAIKGETALILADTADIQPNYATSAAQTTAQNDLDIITGATGVNLLAATQASIDAIETDTSTTLQAELDAIQAAVITNAAGADIAADIIAVKAETANILTDTGTTIPGTITTLQADTDDIQTRLPAALISGRMDSDVEAINDSAPAAVNLSASALSVVPAVCEGTPSTTVIQTDLAEATDDHYIGRIAIFTSGAAAFQASDITDYTGSTGTITVTALTTAPAASDTLVII